MNTKKRKTNQKKKKPRQLPAERFIGTYSTIEAGAILGAIGHMPLGESVHGILLRFLMGSISPEEAMVQIQCEILEMRDALESIDGDL